MNILQPINSNLGSNLLKQATTVISNDLILTLPTSKVPVIPAPGENLVILAPAVQGYGNFSIQMQNWVADYTNVASAAYFRFSLGVENGPTSTYGKFTANLVTYFFGWGIGGEDRAFYNGSQADATSGDGLNNIKYFTNQAVYLDVINTDNEDFEDGDPGNSMRCSLSYYIYDINSGLLIP